VRQNALDFDHMCTNKPEVTLLECGIDVQCYPWCFREKPRFPFAKTQKAPDYENTCIYIYTHIYMYIYVYICII